MNNTPKNLAVHGKAYVKESEFVIVKRGDIVLEMLNMFYMFYIEHTITQTAITSLFFVLIDTSMLIFRSFCLNWHNYISLES